jgi:hypothetical protein
MNIMKNSKKNSSPIYTQAWLSQIAAKVKAHGTDAHRMKAHSRYYLVNWFLRAKAGDAEFAYLLNDSNLTVKLTQNEKNVLGKVAGKVFTFSEISFRIRFFSTRSICVARRVRVPGRPRSGR